MSSSPTGPTKMAAKRRQESDDVNEDLVRRIYKVVNKYGIAEDAIRKGLSFLPINTEADLNDVETIGRFSGCLSAYSGTNAWKQVDEALIGEFVRYRMGKLHGKRIFPSDIFTDGLTQETYVVGAASYYGPEFCPNEKDLRSKNYAVVLGASGTGKSAFALFGLPNMVYPQEDALAILVRAKAVAEGNADVLTDPHRFGQELRKLIKKEIEKEARHPWQLLKCPLFVVVDEAANYGPFHAVGNIGTIATYLTDLAEERPFLVVTGVGLDKINQHVDSLPDMKKFHMQDWDSNKVHLLIKKWPGNNREKETFAMDFVKSNGALLSLITNARCAAILVAILKDNICRFVIDGDYQSMYNVGSLRKIVAWKYITLNGLYRLLPKQRIKVVRQLFITLEESIQNTGIACFPKEPEGFEPEELEAWRGFLNINVEKKGGESIFVNVNVQRSVSVSEAHTTVASAIMDPIGLDAYTDWQGLDENAAFGEAKRYLLSCKKEFDPDSSKLLVRSKVGYPLVEKKGKLAAIEFPDVIASGMVVMLNGPSSSFANVIAPHRLVKVKQAETGTIQIDLEKELGKMGCTNYKKYLKEQVYLHYLAHAWNCEATLEQLGACSNQKEPGQQEELPLASSQVNRMGEYRRSDGHQFALGSTPPPILRAEQSPSSATKESSTGPGSGTEAESSASDSEEWKIHAVPTSEDESKIGHTLLRIRPRDDLPCTEPICAVFVTNARAIELKGADITISRDDVCRLGILSSTETKKVIKKKYRVKKNIEVRFLFI